MMPWVAISGGYSCCKTVEVKGYNLVYRRIELLY
jgi:hypothetical protein